MSPHLVLLIGVVAPPLLDELWKIDVIMVPLFTGVQQTDANALVVIL